MAPRRKFGWIPAALLFAGGRGTAQRFGFQHEDSGPRPTFAAKADFHFIRLEYTDLPQYHRGFGYASRSGTGDGWWLVDWPEADDHFTTGIQRLTRIDTGEPLHFRLTDDRLFDNPWVYATQAGWWGLTDAETSRLREFLLRGGFLVVDDFWGEEQWEVFKQTMDRVLPMHAINDISEADSVMHVLYDIQDKDRTFIPGSRTPAQSSGRRNHRAAARRDGARVARNVRRPASHGGRDQLRYRRRRCMGIRGRPVLPGGDDYAGLSLRDQLHHVFDDPLILLGHKTGTSTGGGQDVILRGGWLPSLSCSANTPSAD